MSHDAKARCHVTLLGAPRRAVMEAHPFASVVLSIIFALAAIQTLEYRSNHYFEESSLDTFRPSRLAPVNHVPRLP